MLRRAPIVFILTLLSFATQAAQPMEQAAERGDVAALRAQLGAGADINQRYDIGRSALLIAARHGKRSAVGALAEAGADLNLQDNNGDTALHLAAAYSHRPVVELLLKLGADTRVKNKSGLTVLEYVQKLANTSPGGDPSLNTMAAFLAKTIPTLPQTRIPPAGTTVGEPALFVEYVTFDIEKYHATPASLQKAAKAAFAQRGWAILKTEPERLIGTYTRKYIEYRVEIRFLPNNKVRIAFINGYHDTRPNYLRNLEKDMKLQLEI